MGAQYVSKKEIAERLNFSLRTIDQWILRGIFPEPFDWVRGENNNRRHLIWEWKTVKAWAKETGRA